MQLKYTIKKNADEQVISLRGDINENSDAPLQELLEKIDSSKLIFNLEDVELINSLGACHWFQFNQELEKMNVLVQLDRCSVSFIECCNIYSKLAPPHTILSLFVPTQCDACNSEKSILCVPTQLQLDNDIPPSYCDDCKKPLQSQVDLTEYMQFLQSK